MRVQIESPGDGWIQDQDVLDTWFSSGLWTFFTTLGWPEKTSDLSKYHPTSMIETGYDILPFWVADDFDEWFLFRTSSFKTIYFHGLVRDGQGRKISKSLGNNIDPVDMGNKYGMDAVRLSLIMGTAPGTDSRISEEKSVVISILLISSGIFLALYLKILLT